MNERRLRAYVDHLELTLALLAYANELDDEDDTEDDDATEGGIDEPPSNVIPLLRARRRGAARPHR